MLIEITEKLMDQVKELKKLNDKSDNLIDRINKLKNESDEKLVKMAMLQKKLNKLFVEAEKVSNDIKGKLSDFPSEVLEKAVEIKNIEEVNKLFVK